MHHPTTCVARREDTARAVMRVETLGNLLKFMNDATLRAEYNKRGNYSLLSKLLLTCVTSTFSARVCAYGDLHAH